MKIEWIDGKPYAPVTRMERVEEPTNHNKRRCQHFRNGQADRKADKPCVSTNGAYLEGYYAPGQKFPPYVTASQATAFKL